MVGNYFLYNFQINSGICQTQTQLVNPGSVKTMSFTQCHSSMPPQKCNRLYRYSSVFFLNHLVELFCHIVLSVAREFFGPLYRDCLTETADQDKIHCSLGTPTCEYRKRGGGWKGKVRSQFRVKILLRVKIYLYEKSGFQIYELWKMG